MACTNPDGSLTLIATQVLEAAQDPLTAQEIAAQMSLPLYRVRSNLRELTTAGLLSESDGKYRRTPLGQSKLG
ncbi:MAG: hypothetical protein GYA17_14670 [Chloroflexi bacterium]|jgi:DNA-binding IclR family transcriptional regulator|nr:hypothetical protein [Anaerolineaceae bacterium]NMB89600.1 hypothetical protein [Chloroflexota bacterium]